MQSGLGRCCNVLPAAEENTSTSLIKPDMLTFQSKWHMPMLLIS